MKILKILKRKGNISNPKQYKVGDNVFCVKFGNGVVVAPFTFNKEPHIRVRFHHHDISMKYDINGILSVDDIKARILFSSIEEYNAATRHNNSYEALLFCLSISIIQLILWLSIFFTNNQ
ncbi:MAG: hypothetical protein ACRDD8_06280 [Bacteroidales bacterium]